MNERSTETKAIKTALAKAGYANIHVSHGTGTGWGWLTIRATEKHGQTWREKMEDIERIAQAVTGRTGAYGGRINIS